MLHISKSTFNTFLSLLKNTDTRETGFLYAITSAGVTYSVAKSCSMGDLVDCSCDKKHGRHYIVQSTTSGSTNNNKNDNIVVNDINGNPNVDTTIYYKNYLNINQYYNLSNGNRQANYESDAVKVRKKLNNKNSKRKQAATKQLNVSPDGLWEWGGCDDNVYFGYKISRNFFDTRYRKRKDLKTLIRLHNHEAGRLAVKMYMRHECEFHFDLIANIHFPNATVLKT